MSMGHLEEEKLQQYFDGELPEGEADEVRRALETSDEARQRLEQLGRLHSLIAMAAEDVAADMPSDDLFAKVRAGIDEQKRRGYGEPFRVVPGEGQRPTHIEGWKVGVSAGVGLAVAAAVLLFVLATESDGPVAETGPAVDPQVEISEEVAVTTIETPQGSEVEEVDFGRNIGTVFEVEGEAGEPIAVVWINDEPADQVTQ